MNYRPDESVLVGTRSEIFGRFNRPGGVARGRIVEKTRLIPRQRAFRYLESRPGGSHIRRAKTWAGGCRVAVLELMLPMVTLAANSHERMVGAVIMVGALVLRLQIEML